MTLFHQEDQRPVEIQDQPPPLAAFASDPETARMLDMTLAIEGYETAEIDVARLSQVIHRYQILSPPSILIVDISDSVDPISELGELAALCPPNIQVFALGTLDSIDFYRRLSALGVADYLIKPVAPEQILEMLANGRGGALATSHPNRQGKIISVIGLRGGVGSTTLALNVGWGMSQIFQRQTALVDLDLSGGSMAIDLGVTPAPGFLDLMANPDRLDSSLLAQSSTPVAERLTLLSPDALPQESGVELELRAAVGLARQLSRLVSFTLLDLTNKVSENIAPLLEVSDIRVLVMDRRMACLRDMAAVLQNLPGGPDLRTVVVLNNPRPAGLSDLTREQISEVVGSDIAVDIPYDKRFLSLTSSSETPLIGGRGAAAKALQAVTADLVGISTKRSRFPWPSILRRQGYVR